MAKEPRKPKVSAKFVKRATEKEVKVTATSRAKAQAQADLDKGINVAEFKKLADAVFKQEDILLTYAGEHRQRCKGPRGVIRNAFDWAKRHGVPSEPAKLKLDLMRLDRKKEKLRREAEPDTLKQVIALEKARKEIGALADTPLGKAHLEKVKAEADDVRPQFLKDKDDENLKAMAEGGIKPLPEEAHALNS